MAIITALKIQKRNPNRINVYLDGEFAFGLARVVAGWLQVGQTLSDDRISALKQDDTQENAMQKALHFLSYRPRTEQEIARKLSEQGFDPSVTAGVLERLRKSQLVNDGTFARLWVESRMAAKPRSRRMLMVEMRKKGVPDGVIEASLMQTPDDLALAIRAGQAQSHRYPAQSYQEFYKKMGGYLGRKGFSYEVVSEVVKQLWKERQAEEENAADQETFLSEKIQ